MFLKKRNVIYLAGALLILLLVLVYFIIRPAAQYGSDQESIKKILESEQLFQNKEVKILEIKDIYDKRAVAFLSNNAPAYAEFNKDEEGNFQLSKFEERRGESLSSFLIQDLKNQEEMHAITVLYIATEDNTISKLELIENNDQVYEREFEVNQNSVVWIELPESKEFYFKHNYYDENGKLIDYKNK